MAECFQRTLIGYCLFFLIGVSPFLLINALWAEVPIFVAQFDSGDIASNIGLFYNLANVVPLIYVLLVTKSQKSRSASSQSLADHFITSFLILLAIVDSFLICLFWRDKADGFFYGLMICTFLSGVIGCASTCVYFNLVGQYKQIFKSSLSAGMGGSQIITSLLAVGQNAGPNPRFSVEVFFFVVGFILLLSLAALWIAFRFRKELHLAADYQQLLVKSAEKRQLLHPSPPSLDGVGAQEASEEGVSDHEENLTLTQHSYLPESNEFAINDDSNTHFVSDKGFKNHKKSAAHHNGIGGGKDSHRNEDENAELRSAVDDSDSGEDSEPESLAPRGIWQLLLRAKVPLFSIFVTSLLNYILLPGMLPFIVFGSEASQATLMQEINTASSIAGVFGRILSGSKYVKLFVKNNILLVLSFQAVVFGALFLQAVLTAPMLQGWLLTAILILTLIAFSAIANGNIATFAFILCSELGFSTSEQQKVTSWTGLLNQLGSLFGSLICYVLVNIHLFKTSS
eukprot:GCRY01002499.1.p1 GENE.GCRY01002499.1~~GCRY01002499.1.p1  ORF type:complete len:512 (+),score=98.39 GCRY01002499.1:229-1764(+)